MDRCSWSGNFTVRELREILAESRILVDSRCCRAEVAYVARHACLLQFGEEFVKVE